MTYNDLFFDYVDSGSVRSAEVVAKTLMPELKANSLLDVGCGRGGWANRWKAAGCQSVFGVDGSYVDRNRLYLDQSEFEVVDLNKPFDLNRRFDLVQSLEVAEHLLPTASEEFVRSLVRHGDVILFSAAVPGQGGTQHINERPVEYWRKLFASHGYASYDFLRHKIAGNHTVEPWYRFNTVLYVNGAGTERLSTAVASSKVVENVPMKEFATQAWRLRRALLKGLPVSLIDKLAVLNALRRVKVAGSG